ncbi:MAG TPA: tRNA (adenosine(37)-N6)-threonylcarbamoyltransferase complex dimerization subunit type 1 TsaB [Dermatophilaceae bacterium]|jgi:tRNA threonylcarbamoyladenosine biosynthesis protein TsaB|nr:tRNA (adenosine(37)-N6)-threonylcarbamoyltransferase complex dimerization subunit type 1 TsaB [Dermatophilaceae bacterium]
MLLLALDTSTTAITAALHDGIQVLAEATTLDARAHGERLAPGIREVLTRAGAMPHDLTDVVVGLGPGPFTGLRVGIVTARTIAHVTGAALHGVCSLDALAYAARDRLPVGVELVVATDARRKEVYWARYAVLGLSGSEASGRTVQARTEPAVTRPADLPDDVRELSAVGRGPWLYPQALTHPLSGSQPMAAEQGLLDVSAAALADLAVQRMRAGTLVSRQEPLYLRRPDAAPHVTAKSALG